MEKAEDIIREAVNEWLREDAPVAVKLNVSPVLRDQLVERVRQAFLAGLDSH